ncbi:dihydrolipoyl dehydrogenase [Persicitalea jodogahamensis]|uniref:Dihydrolipoyl dehydrogenase n=1 Tax=Persicitalea jodogahamensis TaxID=402147 RepID=A0A8J3D4P8_9BACT|nr:dihydrolipoyl dehydrogenase [Persicitalea jodogahamensis]GHB72873.1 mercuric reductase [Persicitalea jodogahamensis]
MNSSKAEKFDVIIIGAGQAGKPLAIYLAEAGWKVAIIEREHLGGSCVNYGCTPTKMLLASAQLAFQARRADDYGVKIGKVSVDFQAVMKRKNEAILSSREGIEDRLGEFDKIDLIRGEASFLGKRSIAVTQESGKILNLTAKRIVIDTGTSPRVPTIEGLEGTPYLTSKTALDLDELPKHLLIIGGGYIGLEFAQMFLRFGSKVTIVESDKQILGKEDKDVAEKMREILEEEGIGVYLNAKIEKVAKENGGVKLSIQSADETIDLVGSHLLVAVGTTPNTKALKPDAAGIKTDKQGSIKVDEYLETAQKGVFAVGDVKGGPEFTHISYDDHRILLERFLEKKKRSIKKRPVPYTVFTDPQLGRIGMSEKEAKKQKIKVKIAKMPMDQVARANETEHIKGFMKVLIDAGNDQILGAAILGMEGGEIMAMLQIAMMGKLRYQKLRDGVFAHPTLAESLNNLFKEVK